MPKSDKEGKKEIVEWCKELDGINTIVDIGAGSGTYARMFRKTGLFRSATMIAVEAWEPYIQEYSLTTRYHKVINSDVRKVDFSEIAPFDLVIMGDVLEHITKEEAVDLVKKLSKFTRYAIISIPIIHYPQDEYEGNPYEVHVKDDWSHNEVLESFSNFEKTFKGERIGCYLLKFK
jgi:cyclopropane fatty-acyl-phospholipid synthase-like methyltransferase